MQNYIFTVLSNFLKSCENIYQTLSKDSAFSIEKFKQKKVKDLIENLNSVTKAYHHYMSLKIQEKDYRIRFTDNIFGKKLRNILLYSCFLNYL